MSIPSSPEFEQAFMEGTQLLHKGHASQAIPLLERANQQKPKHVDAALNLSGAYILTKQFKRAIQVLEPLLENHPDNEMIWINLGAAYLGNPLLATSEEQLKAIQSFKKALEINPAAPSVAYNIGLVYRDRRDYDEAKYWFRKAIQANPKDAHARDILMRLESMADDSTETFP